MRKLEILLLIILLISIVYPITYWFINDTLTVMQLFKKMWYTYIIALGCVYSIVHINNKNQIF